MRSRQVESRHIGWRDDEVWEEQIEMGFRCASIYAGHAALRGKHRLLPSQVHNDKFRDAILMARTAASEFYFLGLLIRLRIARGFNRDRLLQKKLALSLSGTLGNFVVDTSLL